MANGTVIRLAEEPDVEAVAKLASRWENEGVTYGEQAPTDSWFRERLGNYFLVALVGEQLIGYIQGEVRVADESVSAILPVATAALEVQNLYVAPEHRSRGVGGRLLEAVLAEGEREGIERSILFTGASDASAVIRFYSRYGYRPWGIQMFR